MKEKIDDLEVLLSYFIAAHEDTLLNVTLLIDEIKKIIVDMKNEKEVK
jgi:hypothetical protein